MIIYSSDPKSLLSYVKSALDIGLAAKEIMKDNTPSKQTQSNLASDIVTGVIIANNSLQAYSTYKNLKTKEINILNNPSSYNLGRIEGKVYELNEKEQRNYRRIQHLEQEIKDSTNSILVCCKRKKMNDRLDELSNEMDKLQKENDYLIEHSSKTDRKLQDQEKRIKKLEGKWSCEIF